MVMSVIHDGETNRNQVKKDATRPDRFGFFVVCARVEDEFICSGLAFRTFKQRSVHAAILVGNGSREFPASRSDRVKIYCQAGGGSPPRSIQNMCGQPCHDSRPSSLSKTPRLPYVRGEPGFPDLQKCELPVHQMQARYWPGRGTFAKPIGGIW